MLVAVLCVGCFDASVKDTLIVREVKATKNYDSKFAVRFYQESPDTDFVFYTNTNYKVGDTLIK